MAGVSEGDGTWKTDCRMSISSTSSSKKEKERAAGTVTEMQTGE